MKIRKKATGHPVEIISVSLSTRVNPLPTANLAKAAMFTSLAVGAGYALLLVPNIELITAIVFISGFYLGSRWGFVIGMTGEFIFSSANPLGSGLIFPPLLLSQVMGMGIVGVVGGMTQKIFNCSVWTTGKVIWLGCVGGGLTFIYDSLTTLSFPLAAGYEWKQTGAIYMTGLGFMILHQLSNIIIFITALPKVFSRISS